MHEFRELEGDEEKAAARLALEKPLDGEVFVAKAYHRCTYDGCRRTQRKNRWWLRATLPEEG
ncbi:hypothetical protein ACGH7X_13520 [Streptomyces sp. BBFR51]|uniref:hypothetical protein n=1 Tax=Streptomyces sp. BBFR51 TaxID=3372856 RepID=UPI0037DCAEF1